MSEQQYDDEQLYKGTFKSNIPGEVEFDEWVEFGMRKGWCGPPVCSTHDGVPYSELEEDMWSEGEDPCVHVIRLYEDEEQKAGVEKAHSPTNWRNHYTK